MPYKAKPAALKKLHGSTEPSDEPVAHGDLVVDNAAPANLSPLQREIWDYTLAHAPRNVLKRIDKFVLVAWCVSVSEHQIALEALNALGGDRLAETPNGHRQQNAWIGMLNAQASVMRALAGEFGFTPVARARLGSIGSQNAAAIAGEALSKPIYGKDGPRESIEDYLDRAPRATTKH